MIELNYGKYSIPETLKKIIDLQNQLDKEGLLEYGDLLGYYFSYEGLDSRYLNTPLDVISFANSGQDGIHFGFLTDFGQVEDLEHAFIVRVSPMDFDDPVKIVSRNIHDFMSILCYFPNALDMVDMRTSKEEFARLIEEYPELSTHESEQEENKKVRDIVSEILKLENLEALDDYLVNLREAREQEIVLPTEDGIGVIFQGDGEKQIVFNFAEVEYLDVKQVKQFFQKTSFAAKLAFLRDAQSKGLIFEEEEVKEFLKEHLRAMHLYDEAVRISYPE